MIHEERLSAMEAELKTQGAILRRMESRLFGEDGESGWGKRIRALEYWRSGLVAVWTLLTLAAGILAAHFKK